MSDHIHLLLSFPFFPNFGRKHKWPPRSYLSNISSFYREQILVIILLSCFIFNPYFIKLKCKIPRQKHIRIHTSNFVKCGFPFSRIIEELYQKPQIKDPIGFIKETFDLYKIHQDQNSQIALKYAIECFLGYIDSQQCPEPYQIQLQHFQYYLQNLSLLHRPEGITQTLEEVFYFHHGLRFSSQKVKDYIKEKDILDIGGFIGDSAYVLSNYTNARVFSYELSPLLSKINKRNMEKNFLTDKVYTINKGMSNVIKEIYLDDTANLGTKIEDKGNILVNITTISHEDQIFNFKLGFIKADVEGVGLEVIKGGEKEIKRDRPVISVGIYHSFNEFFVLPHYIRSTFPNYFCKFESQNPGAPSLGELALICFPAEIEFEIYPH